jgi:transposase
MTSRFDDLAGQLIGAVRAGQTLDAAAAQAGISIATVRTWARRGRKDPEGRFGEFARALDAAREASRGDPSALDRSEFERHLAKAIRGGSVQAMKLWATLHREDDAPAEPGDEFERFDELAKRRDRAA